MYSTKKFAIATIIVGLFILYSLLFDHTNTIAIVPGNSTNSNSNSPSQSTTQATSSPTAGATNTANSAHGLYKDGSYIGSVQDASWGNVQVKAIIQNGKITDVQFLQAPNDRNRSVMINNSADSQLVSEAIQAQSANVDIVTGATDTSQAFIQSLTDALAQAKA